MNNNAIREHASKNASMHDQSSDMLNRRPNRYIQIHGGNREDTVWEDQGATRVDDKHLDLKVMQEELFEYRHMLDKLVRERTARLDRRILILKYCHDNLVMRHNKLSQMYRDLLVKCRSIDANISV